LPIDPLLVFVTGGLAYGQITFSTSVGETFTGPCFCGAIIPTAGSASTTRAGWTVGGGAEYAIAQNWSLKAEYLYFNPAINLTPRVGHFITMDGVELHEADVPPGTHYLRVEVKDSAGRLGSTTFAVMVAH
jgi:outer membrane immunogenic protein